MGYVSVPIETNPEILADDVYTFIRSVFPAWTPSDGNLDVMIIRAFAAKAAEIRTLASDVPDSIFASLGASLYAIPPVDATSATGDTTWTLTDLLGHTIPAGTIVGIRNTAGDLITFQTLADVVVPAGSNATAAGAVAIIATEPGLAGSDLSGAVELVTVIDWVNTVTLVNPTTGGVDAETNDDYLNRLARKLQSLSLTPILPTDFAEAAKDADPGVYRAVAIDGYNTADATYNNPRMVTIAAVDSAGNGVSGTIKAAIAAYIEARREVNFVVNTMNPNYTIIDVAATVAVLSGYDAATVKADVVAAITDYLSPANWGADPTSSDADTWTEQETVYYNELIALVSNVTGVERVTALTLNIHGNPPGTADLALTTPASLTQPGTITAP